MTGPLHRSIAARALMQGMSDAWHVGGDPRQPFLRCYALMTDAMIRGLGTGDFEDSEWVDDLLTDFAQRYFEAMAAYDRAVESVPTVWRLANDSCRDPAVWPLQRLLLGINAHINLDLPLTVAVLLSRESRGVDAAARRRGDYERVNDIIGRTLDQVQDVVVEPGAPWLEAMDVLLGRADEFVASRLLYRWRDRAWDHALQLATAPDQAGWDAVIGEVERDALRTADAILLSGGMGSVTDLFR